MDATSRRFGSLLEWLCAALCAGGGALLLAIPVHSLRHVPAVVPVIAKEAPDPPPFAGIPPGVARVPLLLLENNRKVHVGDRFDEVASQLGSSAQLSSELRENVGRSIRVTRFYTDIGVQYILVFDAATRQQDLRLSAIFIR